MVLLLKLIILRVVFLESLYLTLELLNQVVLLLHFLPLQFNKFLIVCCFFDGLLVLNLQLFMVSFVLEAVLLGLAQSVLVVRQLSLVSLGVMRE